MAIENGLDDLGSQTTMAKQRFEIDRKLGSGTYGKVYLAFDTKTDEQVAVKIIKKSAIKNEQDLVRIRREIRIMSHLSHPNIIEVREVFENKEKIVIVMEYAAGGELYDFVSSKGCLDEDEARRIFREIVSAVFYCHSHKVAHRDLKLENILLDVNMGAKIGDFGLSNYFNSTERLKTFCGSPLYASPEIINGTPYIGPEVDCWSLGVLLYTLVYGSMPFDGRDFNRMIRQIKRGSYFEPDSPSSASMLIRTMLRVNPERRADIEQIAQHWWLNFSCEELTSIKDLPENQVIDPTPIVDRHSNMVVQQLSEENDMFNEYTFLSNSTRRKLEEFKRRRRDSTPNSLIESYKAGPSRGSLPGSVALNIIRQSAVEPPPTSSIVTAVKRPASRMIDSLKGPLDRLLALQSDLERKPVGTETRRYSGAHAHPPDLADMAIANTEPSSPRPPKTKKAEATSVPTAATTADNLIGELLDALERDCVPPSLKTRIEASDAYRENTHLRELYDAMMKMRQSPAPRLPDVVPAETGSMELLSATDNEAELCSLSDYEDLDVPDDDEAAPTEEEQVDTEHTALSLTPSRTNDSFASVQSHSSSHPVTADEGVGESSPARVDPFAPGLWKRQSRGKYERIRIEKPDYLSTPSTTRPLPKAEVGRLFDSAATYITSEAVQEPPPSTFTPYRVVYPPITPERPPLAPPRRIHVTTTPTSTITPRESVYTPSATAVIRSRVAVSPPLVERPSLYAMPQRERHNVSTITPFSKDINDLVTATRDPALTEVLTNSVDNTPQTSEIDDRYTPRKTSGQRNYRSSRVSVSLDDEDENSVAESSKYSHLMQPHERSTNNGVTELSQRISRLTGQNDTASERSTERESKPVMRRFKYKRQLTTLDTPDSATYPSRFEAGYTPAERRWKSRSLYGLDATASQSELRSTRPSALHSSRYNDNVSYRRSLFDIDAPQPGSDYALRRPITRAKSLDRDLVSPPSYNNEHESRVLSPIPTANSRSAIFDRSDPRYASDRPSTTSYLSYNYYDTNSHYRPTSYSTVSSSVATSTSAPRSILKNRPSSYQSSAIYTTSTPLSQYNRPSTTVNSDSSGSQKPATFMSRIRRTLNVDSPDTVTATSSYSPSYGYRSNSMRSGNYSPSKSPLDKIKGFFSTSTATGSTATPGGSTTSSGYTNRLRTPASYRAERRYKARSICAPGEYSNDNGMY